MRIPIILTLLTTLSLIPWTGTAQGLRFNGLEKPIDERTSYNVFSSKSPEFSGYFDIGFDLSLYPESALGYIVRIKNEKAGLIYNLFYDGQGNDLTFKLNDEARYNLINARISREEFRNKTWMKVRLTFDLKRDSLHLDIGRHRFSVAVENLPDKFRPVINFGKSDYFIDVPSFAIKDLYVGNIHRYAFPLSESAGDGVHDSKGRKTGEVQNPVWLINEAYEWKCLSSASKNSTACAGYDARSKSVYYFDRDSILFYNILAGKTEVHRFANRCPVHITLGTSFIDTLHNTIYAYEVYHEDSNLSDSASVACLDLENLTWKTLCTQQLPMQMHHHATFFDQSRMRYTIFGGFGNMHYNGTFYTYDINSAQWYPFKRLSGDTICPRYFSSMGYDPESSTLYIYGGMGNESGEQVVGRKYLYDLYSLNFATNEINKLWDNVSNPVNMVPVRNMFLDNNGHFFTLCYPESHSESALQLYRFSINDGSHELLADTIPIHSEKITTNADLYYDRTLGKIFVTVQESDDDISSTLKIYSLSMIPAYFEDSISGEAGSRFLRWILPAALVIAGALCCIYLLERHRRRSSPGNSHADDVAETRQIEQQYASEEDTSAKSTNESGIRPDSILLFGDFTATDHTGHNVSGLFTGKQKQMLGILLEYSPTGGISSKKLSALLWPGKSEDKVKNTRNTTISHLRKTLSMFEGICIVFENGSFKVHTAPGFYCDFLRIEELLSSDDIQENLHEITGIVSRGKFLRFSDDPVFDEFKAGMERKIEPVISAGIARIYEKKDYRNTLSMAEILFSIDPLNDKALLFTVRTLCRLNRLEDALLRYQAFTEEYRKAYGEDYPYAFDEL